MLTVAKNGRCTGAICGVTFVANGEIILPSGETVSRHVGLYGVPVEGGELYKLVGDKPLWLRRTSGEWISFTWLAGSWYRVTGPPQFPDEPWPPFRPRWPVFRAVWIRWMDAATWQFPTDLVLRDDGTAFLFGEAITSDVKRAGDWIAWRDADTLFARLLGTTTERFRYVAKSGVWQRLSRLSLAPRSFRGMTLLRDGRIAVVGGPFRYCLPALEPFEVLLGGPFGDSRVVRGAGGRGVTHRTSQDYAFLIWGAGRWWSAESGVALVDSPVEWPQRMEDDVLVPATHVKTINQDLQLYLYGSAAIGGALYSPADPIFHRGRNFIVRRPAGDRQWIVFDEINRVTRYGWNERWWQAYECSPTAQAALENVIDYTTIRTLSVELAKRAALLVLAAYFMPGYVWVCLFLVACQMAVAAFVNGHVLVVSTLFNRLTRPL